MIPATATAMLDTLLERTRAAIKAAKLERLLPTLDHIERTQRPQLLQMVEEAFGDLTPAPDAVPLAHVEPKRFKALLAGLSRRRQKIILAARPVQTFHGEAILGTSSEALRLGVPAPPGSWGLAPGVLDAKGELTLESLHQLQARGADALVDYAQSSHDPDLQRALATRPPDKLALPEGAPSFLLSALHPPDGERPTLEKAYWQDLRDDFAQRAFPELPLSSGAGWIWATNGHRLHAVALPAAPTRALEGRWGSNCFVPVSAPALLDVATHLAPLDVYTTDAGDVRREAAVLSPLTLTRSIAGGAASPPEVSAVFRALRSCSTTPCPMAWCDNFQTSDFKTALKNLKAEVKHKGLKTRSDGPPFVLSFSDERATLQALDPSRKDQDAGDVLAHRELPGWKVEASFRAFFDTSYAQDAFSALAPQLRLTFRGYGEGVLIESLGRPDFSALVMPLRFK